MKKQLNEQWEQIAVLNRRLRKVETILKGLLEVNKYRLCGSCEGAGFHSAELDEHCSSCEGRGFKKSFFKNGGKL